LPYSNEESSGIHLPAPDRQLLGTHLKISALLICFLK
jgi:hypothetical protein